MHAWDNPTDPERRPPDAPDTPDEPGTPEDRPPVERDPEGQRAPGAGQEDPDSGDPPMQAVTSERVGNDNIREGRVGGVMGSPTATRGQGQGG